MSTPPTKHPVGIKRPLPSRAAPGAKTVAPPHTATHATPASPPVTTPNPDVDATPASPPVTASPPTPETFDAALTDTRHFDESSDPAPVTPGLAAGDVVDLATGEIILDEPTSAPVTVTPTVQSVVEPVAAPSQVAALPGLPTLPTGPGLSTDVDTEEAWEEPVANPRDPITYIDDGVGEFDEDADDPPAVTHRPTKSRRGVKLTARDIEITRYLVRYRFSSYAQIVSHFDTSFDVMRRRMPKLQREGIVKSMAPAATRFLLWRVTDLGAELSGLNLTAPRQIAVSTIRHDLGLVDMGIRFEAAGELVVTEREIRAADTRDAMSDRMQIARTQGQRTLTTEPLFAVGFGVANGKQRGYLHIPDMVLVRPPVDGQPQSIAIELELNHKSPSRVSEVLLAYKHATNIGAVIFYTDRKAIRNLINQCAINTLTTGLVSIRRWEPAPESGPIIDKK